MGFAEDFCFRANFLVRLSASDYAVLVISAYFIVSVKNCLHVISDLGADPALWLGSGQNRASISFKYFCCPAHARGQAIEGYFWSAVMILAFYDECKELLQRRLLCAELNLR